VERRFRFILAISDITTPEITSADNKYSFFLDINQKYSIIAEAQVDIKF
jgi:hypothetical protein